MNEVKLLLHESPIKVYSNYAYMLSVLLNQEEAFEWFYSNFIQVKYIRETEDCRFIFNYSLGNLTKYFYNLPYLKVRSLDRDFMLKYCGDIIEFLSHALKNRYYIVTVVDNYFIPMKNEYNNRHNLHLIMLYGFSQQKKCFYSMGYDNGFYQESQINFLDFCQAITSMEGKNIHVRDDYCMMYKLQDKNELVYPQENFNYFPYRFNKKFVKRSLEEYYDSTCSDEHFCTFYTVPDNAEYGISYYDAMIEYVKKFVNGIYKDKLYIICFHGMLEHKEIMLQRIKFMQDKHFIGISDDIIKEYERLVTQAKIVRNYAIKYNLTMNVEMLNKMIGLLNDMYLSEKSVIKKLIYMMD